MKYQFPRYSNYTKIDKYLVEQGYRKYGEDGVNLVRRYCVSHIDNENTQFIQYLYQQSQILGQNLFEMHPGIDKDYCSDAYYSRITKEQLFSFLGGVCTGTAVVFGLAFYCQKKTGQKELFDNTQKFMAILLSNFAGLKMSDYMQQSQ